MRRRIIQLVSRADASTSARLYLFGRDRFGLAWDGRQKRPLWMLSRAQVKRMLRADLRIAGRISWFDTADRAFSRG